MTIPTSAADITLDWLAGMLPNASIRSVAAEPLGNEDRGSTGRIYRVSAMLDQGPIGLVVKVPDPSHWERSLREIRLLESLDLPVHTPRLLSSDAFRAGRATALLLADVPGEAGDALIGATSAQLDGMVHDLALLHASFRSPEALEKLEWLPAWGQGTKNARRPHRRRVDRYRSRVEPFLATYASGSADWVADLLHTACRGLDHRLASLAAIPPTLIHADVHLGNIIFGKKETVFWLDWQSASRGPGMYDLTRLLSETLDMTSDLPLARRLVHRYAGHLACRDVPRDVIEAEIAHLPSMAVAVLVGFVSGYGGRAREDLSIREQQIVDRAVTESGLFGFVRHMLDS